MGKLKSIDVYDSNLKKNFFTRQNLPSVDESKSNTKNLSVFLVRVLLSENAVKLFHYWK